MWGRERDLNSYLYARLDEARKELDGLDADYLLSENEDVLIAVLAQKHFPEPVAVNWDAVTRTDVTETTTQLRDQFDHEKIYTVPASSVSLTFPVLGTADLLNYQATTFTMGPREGRISGAALLLEIVERSLTAETTRARMERLRIQIDQRAEWANADLCNFLTTAERTLRQVHADRKQRILSDRAVEDALGIPVKSSSDARQPVPARRKQVTFERRRQQAAFVPEPVLDEAIYRDVLEAVQSWARSLERTPKTAEKLDEEELRDLLLGTLNGYWNGAAGGELFNGSGKTDILIRADDRNVFVGECKFWRGPKGAADAIDQLLSYLVWRDSKAALIMFIKTADPSATIEKLQAAVEGHAHHVLTQQGGDASTQVDYVVTADDEGRRVSLAVIPVVIRPTRDA